MSKHDPPESFSVLSQLVPIRNEPGEKMAYSVVFECDEDAHAFACTFLESQPAAVSATNEVVIGLLGIIAEQQRQIEELRNNIQQIAKSRVAVEAQDKIIALIQHLTGKGRDVSGPELSVRLSASVQTDDLAETSESESNQVRSRQSSVVSGEIKGLLEVLAGLSGHSKNSKERVLNRVRAVESRELHRTEMSYDGELSIRFASISGYPLVKAQARTGRRVVRRVH